MRSIGRKQMRSISGMLSDDLAGDAKHHVPLPQEGMPSDEMAGGAKRRVPIPLTNMYAFAIGLYSPSMAQISLFQTSCLEIAYYDGMPRNTN